MRSLATLANWDDIVEILFAASGGFVDREGKIARQNA